jgi:hypothetical protein
MCKRSLQDATLRSFVQICIFPSAIKGAEFYEQRSNMMIFAKWTLRETVLIAIAATAATIIVLLVLLSISIEPRRKTDLGTQWRCSTTLGLFTECTKLAKY